MTNAKPHDVNGRCRSESQYEVPRTGVRNVERRVLARRGEGATNHGLEILNHVLLMGPAPAFAVGITASTSARARLPASCATRGENSGPARVLPNPWDENNAQSLAADGGH